jgi:hypothetical protein
MAIRIRCVICGVWIRNPTIEQKVCSKKKCKLKYLDLMNKTRQMNKHRRKKWYGYRGELE